MNKTQRIRDVILGMMIMLIVCTTIVPTFAATVSKQLTVVYRDIKLVVDGIPITPKDAAGKVVEPFVSEGTTYLPVRALAEALGKTVEWDGTTSTVYVGRKPGSVQYMPDLLKPYISDRYYEYSFNESGGAENFSMAGVKYTDGFSFGCSEREAYAVFNLNGQYDSLTALVGHMQDTPNYDSKMCVFADEVLVEERVFTSQGLPETLTLDLRGVLQLKITFDGSVYSRGTTYVFANPVLE